jgi:hypothetical protein
MKCTLILAALMLLPIGVMAQSALPVGTILPVSLDTSLKANKVHVGQEIRAKVMQNVPGTPVRRGATVLGHVVQAGSSKNGQTRLEFCFDAVKVHSRRIPLKADLRALASLMEVEAAQIPEESADRSIPPEVATTQQIGGEQVYRGGGPVADGDLKVGEPTPYGVLALPRVLPGQPCRGIVADNQQPQALWLFSTDACGVYGFSDIHIEQAGRSDPAGTIILVSDKGKLEIGSGSGLLLRVLGS